MSVVRRRSAGAVVAGLVLPDGPVWAQESDPCAGSRPVEPGTDPDAAEDPLGEKDPERVDPDKTDPAPARSVRPRSCAPSPLRCRRRSTRPPVPRRRSTQV